MGTVYFLRPGLYNKAKTEDRSNMLIEYGNTVVRDTWELNEESPTGYSRIYYVLEGEVTYEAADLLYHLLVLCCDQGVTPADLWDELARRR